jgi:hypothetical protein
MNHIPHRAETTRQTKRPRSLRQLPTAAIKWSALLIMLCCGALWSISQLVDNQQVTHRTQGGIFGAPASLAQTRGSSQRNNPLFGYASDNIWKLGKN